MAWNQQSTTGHTSLKRRSLPRRITIAIIMFLAICVLAIAFLLSNLTSRSKSATDDVRITSVQRETQRHIKESPQRPIVAKPKQYKDMTNGEKLASIRAKYGDNIPENLKSVVYYLEHPPKQTYHPARSKESIFRHESERVIASFVTTEPGTWFMRQLSFDESIDTDFAKSMSEAIEISDKDKPEEAELKRLVTDTKAELAERIAAGEKVSDILNMVAKEYYELGQFKRDLQSELARFKQNPQYTDQDIEDFVEAANKMLEKKGLPPMKMPKMVFRHLSLKRAAANAHRNIQEIQ